jgi:single-stranded DNA-binding protein
MNKICLMGRLGSDPKRTGEVVTFSIATSSQKDTTDWHTCKAFKETAKNIEKFFKKGDMIGVEGNVRYNNHEGKWYTTINVSAFHFAGSSKHDTPIVPDAPQPQAAVSQSGDEDDLPF